MFTRFIRLHKKAIESPYYFPAEKNPRSNALKIFVPRCALPVNAHGAFNSRQLRKVHVPSTPAAVLPRNNAELAFHRGLARTRTRKRCRARATYSARVPPQSCSWQLLGEGAAITHTLCRARRHGLDAVLHGLRANGLLGPRAAALRSLALGRLHGLPGVPVHGAPHHDRPVLLGQDSGQVPELAHQEPRHLDGHHHLDHTGPTLLHQHLRLGALCRLSRPRARPVRRPVPQGMTPPAAPRILFDVGSTIWYGHTRVRSWSRTLESL